MFGIMFEVSLLVAFLKISTFMNKPLFIHTSEKLKFMRLHMPSLIQKHAHVKGQRSNHHIFKFQPNPSWAKKRPNRYTSFTLTRFRGTLELLFTNKSNMRHGMRFPTMWYVRPAKPQISLRIRAV